MITTPIVSGEPAQAPGAGQCHGWSGSNGEDGVRWIGRALWRPALLSYLLLAVAFGAGSALLVPDTATPPLAGRIGVDLVSVMGASNPSVDFALFNPAARKPDLDMSVGATPDQAGVPVVRVDVLLPLGVYVDRCQFHYLGDDDANHPESCKTQVNEPGLPTRVTLNLQPHQTVADQDVDLTLSSRGATVAVRGSQVALLMPKVAGFDKQHSVQLQIDLPHAEQYVWQGRFPDGVTEANPGEGSGSVYWTLSYDEATGPPLSAQAVLPAQQKRDTISLYLAGAFVGLAGAALIAAIQEVFAQRRPADDKRQAPAAEAQD